MTGDALFPEGAPTDELAKARADYPEWDIRPVWDGWAAVPKGAVVLHADDLTGLVGKLREQG